MRRIFLFVLLTFSLLARAQLFGSLLTGSKSMLCDVLPGDSIVYYQCHVENAGVQLTTASGQTLNSNPHKCSITEKFVIAKNEVSYSARYYASSYTELPNRRFSGLKIREKPYWNFTRDTAFTLNEIQMKVLLAIEQKGNEAIEYDFVISKNNTNQLIIKHKKNFKQLVIEGDYVLSRLLFR